MKITVNVTRPEEIDVEFPVYFAKTSWVASRTKIAYSGETCSVRAKEHIKVTAAERYSVLLIENEENSLVEASMSRVSGRNELEETIVKNQEYLSTWEQFQAALRGVREFLRIADGVQRHL